MDYAEQGNKLLEQKDFDGAIEKYNSAIMMHPESPDYYVKRSTALSRRSPPKNDEALSDSERAIVLGKNRGKRERIAQGQLRRAIVYYALEQYGNSQRCFEWAKKYDPNEKTLAIWEVRLQNKVAELDAQSEKLLVDALEFPDISISDIRKQAKGSSSVPAKQSDNKAQDTTSVSAGTAAAPSGSTSTNQPAPAVAASTTPASKIRYEWYQTNDTVTIDVMAKGVPQDKTQVEMQAHSVSVSFPLASGADFDLSLDPLYAAIDPYASRYQVFGTKVQCTLKKATPGRKWHDLEGSERSLGGVDSGPVDEAAAAVKRAALTSNESGPSYPTSSKSGPKDWDKLASDLTKKKKKKATQPKEEAAKGDGEDGGGGGEDDEDKTAADGEGEGYDSDEEGGDAVNGFFKKLYKNLDPDSRRAMMKSYQESNGTALSTNWSEVGKGKVETTPPDGMEAKKWEY